MIRLYTSLNMTIKDIEEKLEESQPLKVAYHSDADGVASAALLASMFEVLENDEYPYSPTIFGGFNKGDVALDLGQPINKAVNMICIDHHDHPNPWYPLIWSHVPTGLILYYAFRHRIPDDKLWIVCLSCVGDGQPELIPDEIWDKYWDILWERRGSLYRERYGRGINSFAYPIYSVAASPVNALCRAGRVSEAYKLVSRANSILDIVDDPLATVERESIEEEESKIVSPKNPPKIQLIKDRFGVVTIRSKYSINGRIATRISQNNPGLTILVFNANDGTFSIRGVLAKYLANKLREAGFHAGGHPGFAGGCLLEGQTLEDLTEAIRRIR